MDDLDLDALIEQSLGTDASAVPPVEAASEPVPEAVTPVAAAVTPVAEAGEAPPAAPAEAAGEEPTPAQPEGTSEPAPVVAASSEAAEDPLATANATIAQQAQMLQALLAAREAESQQKAEAARAAAAEQQRQQLKELQERWANMEPDEAARERLQFTAQFAQTQIQQRDQLIAQLTAERERAQAEAAEVENRGKVLGYLTETFGLTEREQRIINRLDDPWKMEELAQEFQSDRQQQTAAARAQRAENVAANRALQPEAAGETKPAQPPRKAVTDYEDLDEFVAAMFA